MLNLFWLYCTYFLFLFLATAFWRWNSYIQNEGHYQIRKNDAKWGPFRHSRSYKVTDFGTNRRLIIRLLIKTIARQVLRIKCWIYESARNLYIGRRAVPLHTLLWPGGALRRGRRHTAAAWADLYACPLLIGQKSSSSGIGPQSLSKF